MTTIHEPPTQKLYRVDSSANGLLASNSFLFASEYAIIRTTPKGVWVQAWGVKKFILNNARKRFAYPTLEEAKVSFIARRRKYVQILEAKIENAKHDIEVATHEGVEINVCPI